MGRTVTIESVTETYACEACMRDALDDGEAVQLAIVPKGNSPRNCYYCENEGIASVQADYVVYDTQR